VLTDVQTNDAGGYSVVVTNWVGSVTSRVAVLTVKVPGPPPLVISPCFPIADTAQAEFALSSAFDGANHLVGVRGSANGPDAVGAQRISPTGGRLGALVDIGHQTAGQTAAPYVAFGVTDYLVAWTDAGSQHAASGNDVYAQFLSPAGHLVGGAFPVSSAPGDQEAHGVTYDGANFLVVWSGAGGLRARRVRPDGQLLGNELLITNAEIEGQVSVAPGGGQHVVAWVEGPDGAYATKAALISASGQMGSILTVSQHTSDRYNPTSVAWGGGCFLVVWHHAAFDGADWNLRGRWVMPDGTMIGDDLPLATGPNDELAMGNNVAFDGESFLLVWTDWAGDFGSGEGTVRGRYWSTSAEPLGAAFLLEGTPARQLAVGLSAGSGRVLTVFGTDFLSPAADLCARFITRPSVQIRRLGPDSVEVTFNGRLQSSTELQTWLDLTPQPTSPWIHPIGEGNRFFRAGGQ